MLTKIIKKIWKNSETLENSEQAFRLKTDFTPEQKIRLKKRYPNEDSGKISNDLLPRPKGRGISG